MNNLSGTYCFSHRSFSTTKLPLRKSICSRKSYPYLKQVIVFIFPSQLSNIQEITGVVPMCNPGYFNIPECQSDYSALSFVRYFPSILPVRVLRKAVMSATSGSLIVTPVW